MIVAVANLIHVHKSNISIALAIIFNNVYPELSKSVSFIDFWMG